MRSKEEAHDYRYFPDPDLPPLEIEANVVERIRANLPELPDAKKARFIKDFGLTSYDASVLVSEGEIADYFESALKASHDEKSCAKMVANWIAGELFAALNRDSTHITDSKVTPQSLAALIDLIQKDPHQ